MGDGEASSAPTANKLESQILEAVLRRESKGTSIKSINRIILKFPKIDETLRKCKLIFQQFDEDKNGALDIKELRNCFEKLQVKFTNDEINDIFKTCDLNDDMGISFNEFIVLLCLVYLLKEDPAAPQSKSRMGIPDLEATFETLVESFVFLDSNKDGHVSKNEMIRALEETRQSEGQIALKRFGKELHPWSSTICMAIDLEAMGIGGSSAIFQAGPHPWAIENFALVAKYPSGQIIAQIGDGEKEYMDDDLDQIREEWAQYVTNFIFRS